MHVGEFRIGLGCFGMKINNNFRSYYYNIFIVYTYNLNMNMNDSRYKREVLEMPPKLSFETRDTDNLPKLSFETQDVDNLPKMAPMMAAAPMKKMIIPQLVPGMPDGYYTEQTIRPYIQNPVVYDNVRHYEGLQHRAYGNTQTSPPRLQNQC